MADVSGVRVPVERTRELHVVGVRTWAANRISYYRCDENTLQLGDWVMVPVTDGHSIARVVIAPGQVLLWQLNDDLESIDRRLEEDTVTREAYHDRTQRGQVARSAGERRIGGLGHGGRIQSSTRRSFPERESAAFAGPLLAIGSIEDHEYRRAKAQVPALGQRVMTSLGVGTVVRTQPLRRLVTVRLADGGEFLVSSAELPTLEVLEGPKATRPEQRNSSGHNTENQ